MKQYDKIRTYWRLGWRSIIDVGLYRIGLKTGWHPVLKIKAANIPTGDFFNCYECSNHDAGTDVSASLIWQDRPWAFGKPAGETSDNPPNWHSNIFTGQMLPDPNRNWYEIGEFSDVIGDIKTVWEASRFDWLVIFAQNYALGDKAALAKINQWLSDWSEKNPAYQGPNWICAQEASLRIAHIYLTAHILGSINQLSPTLEIFLLNHLRRIEPTIAYARGQDNNHATSEAMGLFIGGQWLAKYASKAEIRQEGVEYALKAILFAQERINKLIFEDGGFAQYSFVYHRLMLDSMSLMELARREFDVPKFADLFYEKMTKASQWLRYFTEETKGDTPNMGSNDGAWLLPIGSGHYRDFRPSCALATHLFEHASTFQDAQSVKDLLGWLDISPHSNIAPTDNIPVKLFADSGIIALRHGKFRAYMRLPVTDYRPHQSDILHVDLWDGPINIARDAGSYSYALEEWDYFPSTKAHNCISFDNRDQMPRISRFLLGSWIKLHHVEIDVQNNSATASYYDAQKNYHKRKITLHDDMLDIEDTVKGPFEHAHLYWHMQDIIRSDTNHMTGSHYIFSFNADHETYNMIDESKESLFYGHYEYKPYFIANIDKDGIYRSQIKLGVQK